MQIGMNIQDCDIQDYVKLCKFLGSDIELIQGSGGNFSVKTEDQILIKSSGTSLAETTESSGYTICQLSKVRQCIQERTETLDDTIIGGTGKPSMELFFHVLPYKWVVHTHPTFILTQLCTPNWKSITSALPHMHIPYLTPGIELGLYILQLYDNERVLFLQNHGVIVCGNTISEVLECMDEIYYKYNVYSEKVYHKYTAAFELQEEMNRHYNITNTLKLSKLVKSMTDRIFFPLTPDISLFLKYVPMVQEDKSTTPSHTFKSYCKTISTEPSVVSINGFVYTYGKSYKHCCYIEDILYSYLQIMSHTNPSTLIFFDSSAISTLTSSDKETYRLNLV
jgi:rhamnose utilization protein RhaD (predicted bifunctional aldolase and dehydrogenase)